MTGITNPDAFPWAGQQRYTGASAFNSNIYVETGSDVVVGTPAPTISNISAAGNSQATAAQLNSQVNIVSTVGSGQGVILVAGNPYVSVFNRGANVLNVYPPVGSKIESLSANSPVTIAAVDGSATFVQDPNTSTQWWST